MSGSDMNLAAEGVQRLLREVNERIRLIAAGDHPSFLCECANLGCTVTINVGIADYERVREFPRRFILRAGARAHRARADRRGL